MKQTRHCHSIRGRTRRQTRKCWKKHKMSFNPFFGGGELPRIVVPTIDVAHFDKDDFSDQPGNLDASEFEHKRPYTLPITHILLK